MEANKFPLIVVKMNAQPLPTQVEKKDINWILFGEKKAVL